MAWRTRQGRVAGDGGRPMLLGIEVRHRRGPRRPLPWVRVLLAAFAFGALAAVVASRLDDGGRTENPVARRARLALTPIGRIAHIVSVSWGDTPAAERDPIRLRTEQWASDDPMRWRVVQVVPPGMLVSDDAGVITGRVEFAYAAGTISRYVARRDALDLTTHYRRDDQATRVPGLTDPLSLLRTMLERDKLHDRGIHVVDGRRVRRLVGETKTAFQHRITTLLVDPRTSRPLSGSFATIYAKQPLRFVTRFRILSYELLPEDAAGRALLSIHTTSRTKVTTRTQDEARAEDQKQGS